jgi:hypothetical protein
VETVTQHILQAADAGPRRHKTETELGRAFSQKDLMGRIVGLIEDSEATAKESGEEKRSSYAWR